MLTIYSYYAAQNRPLCSIKRPLCSISTPLSSTMLLLRHRTERPAAFSRESRPSGSALVLLQLSEASCCDSSPSLETVVNVADARLSDGDLAPYCQYLYVSPENRTCAGQKYAQFKYASIMLDALKVQLCAKLCRHNIRTPSLWFTYSECGDCDCGDSNSWNSVGKWHLGPG